MPPTISKIKILIHSLPQSRCIFSNTRDNFYLVTFWFNKNIQEFEETLASSFEGAPFCIVIYKTCKVYTILQNCMQKIKSLSSISRQGLQSQVKEMHKFVAYHITLLTTQNILYLHHALSD